MVFRMDSNREIAVGQSELASKVCQKRSTMGTKHWLSGGGERSESR